MNGLLIILSLLISTSPANASDDGSAAEMQIISTFNGTRRQGRPGPEPELNMLPDDYPGSSWDHNWGPGQHSASEELNIPSSGAQESLRYRTPFLPGSMDRSQRIGSGLQGPDTLYAIDTATGELLWILTGVDFGSSSLFVKNGRVYISRDGSLMCLDAFNGEVIWFLGNESLQSNGPSVSSSVIGDAGYYPSESVTLGFDPGTRDGSWSTVVSLGSALSSSADVPDLLSGTSINDDDRGGPVSYSVESGMQ